MSIDEVCLGDDFYTIITNKAARGREGALAALIKGTKNEVVSAGLSTVPVTVKMKVEEITADLANTMDWICRTNFQNATIISDRFHVQQLVIDGVQEIRIRLRREAMDEENERIVEARREGRMYRAKRYSNGDTEKQLLARSRYLLFKPSNRWSESQRERAEILFKEFPELKKAYDLSMNFRSIYENATTRNDAKKRIGSWLERVSESELKPLISAANSVQVHLGKILQYFPGRQTNASAESFNAKLKGFRNLVRGARDMNFFLFRLTTFYS